MIGKIIVSILLCSFIICGACVEYVSDDNGTYEIKVKVNPPVFRDEESFEVMYQKAKKIQRTDPMVAYLEDEIPKDPRVFSSQQIIKLLTLVGWASEKVKLINVIQNYIYELSPEEVLEILDNVGFSSDKLLILDAIADFLSDISEETKQKIIKNWGMSSDQKKAKEILDRLKPRSKIYGTVKEKVCIFVIDVSPSMWWTFTAADGSQVKRIDFVKQQLTATIKDQLEPYQNFNVVVFGWSAYKWKSDVVAANDENINSAIKWIQGRGQISATDISGALGQAIATNSELEAIYLLSDGVPNYGITTIDKINSYLTDKEKSKLVQGKPKFRVNVVGFTLGGKDSEAEKIQAQKYLESIATITSGSFRKFTD